MRHRATGDQHTGREGGPAISGPSLLPGQLSVAQLATVLLLQHVASLHACILKDRFFNEFNSFLQAMSSSRGGIQAPLLCTAEKDPHVQDLGQP